MQEQEFFTVSEVAKMLKVSPDTGPCLDFSYDSPHYWSEEHEKTRRSASLLPSWSENRRKTFL
ncbi:MAG: hypothetical protein WBD68_14360, partial [Candidatus Sulfotelmatobacter sp.]